MDGCPLRATPTVHSHQARAITNYKAEINKTVGVALRPPVHYKKSPSDSRLMGFEF